MGTYYYIKDPDSECGLTPVFEDDYIAAILSIAKKRGVKITNKMILEEVYGKKKSVRKDINIKRSKSQCRKIAR